MQFNSPHPFLFHRSFPFHPPCHAIIHPSISPSIQFTPQRESPTPPSPSPTPPPPSAVLGEALPEYHAAPTPPRRRAAAGVVFPNLPLSPCWIKAWETSPGCTCVERGGAVVRRLDRNQPRSESLRVRLPHPRSCNASASRSTMVCRCAPLPLVARILHRLILVMHRKF